MFLYTRSVEETCPNWAQWRGLAPDIAAALGLEVPVTDSDAATAATADSYPPPSSAAVNSCKLEACLHIVAASAVDLRRFGGTLRLEGGDERLLEEMALSL